MELINYAYVALITFVFLAVIAIGISYLSYKKKHAHTNQENLGTSAPQNIIQKQIVHEHKSAANKIEHDQNRQILHAEKKIEIGKQEKNRDEKSKKNSEQEVNINSERMQVIKDLSNKKSSNTKHGHFSSRINKQIDKNDDEFYTPNTDINK
ncbi:hypothetical protein ABRY23_07015 [Melioribacteraceae bacterium 4301-Me]|uniref:hypothetical protein n=1 Tax=Pyranulibacter aquaticus TaxID=3163344 RepID=UPI003595A91B